MSWLIVELDNSACGDSLVRLRNHYMGHINGDHRCNRTKKIRKQRYMKILKVLNPIIWCWNFFKYTAHLDMYEFMDEYEPYDYNKHDTKYF